MENSAPTRQESIEKLRELVKDVQIAQLSTVEDDGSIRSRPMYTLDVEFDGTLWFFTSSNSPKVSEIKHNQQVGVSFSNPEKQHYVSMSGTAELTRDRQKIDEYWNPAFTAWFPEGKDAPELALLKITVEKAEYWDAPPSAVAHLIALAGSLLTGEPAKPDDNAKVDLAGAKA